MALFLYISFWTVISAVPLVEQHWLSPGGHRAMKAALWALGLGTLLLTLRAVPVGKFLLPSSLEASGVSRSVEAETLVGVVGESPPVTSCLSGSCSAQRWMGCPGAGGHVGSKVHTPRDSCSKTD